jgi:hypothetical protein
VTSPERGDRTGRNAGSLATAIAALGVQCSLEARGGLALLMPVQASVEKLREPEIRRAVLALAREHGFTHVGIELPNDSRGAGARNDDAPLLRD